MSLPLYRVLVCCKQVAGLVVNLASGRFGWMQQCLRLLTSKLYIPHLDPRSDVVDAVFRGRPARFHWVEGPVPQAAIEQDGRVVPFVLTELPFF